MITFLINLSTEKISESTMKIYLYPYLKENKLRIIEGYGLEYNDIVNDIKYYIYNSDNIKSERKEFQLLIVLPIFSEKVKYFGGNLTNNIYEVSEKIEERLLEEKVEPNEVSYLVLDYLERDFIKKAIDINGGISEELNVDGYVSSPIFTIDDIENIEKLYKKSIEGKENKEEAWSALKEELENFFREKKELVYNTETGKIKDSAIIEHTKKYRIIAKDLESTLRYEFSKKDLQIMNIQNNLVEILKKNDYYYDFLFNVLDLKKLQFIWEKNNIVMREEESYNLSDEFIEKIAQLKEELFEEIRKIISQKKEALKNIIKSEKGENCYLREKTLDEVQKEFVNNYLEKYLGEIIKTKTLKTQRVETPLERIKYLLKKYYSLQKISSLQRNNIYRIPFIKNNTLKYNENLIKFIYLIMFLMEYGEQKEGYIGNGKSLSLEDVKYRKYYLEELFNKYQNTLRNEEGNIDIRQKNLKTSAEISYYAPQNVTDNRFYNGNKIKEKELPEFLKYYEENDIKRYKKEWLEDIEVKLDEYIDETNEALFDYQNRKNKFMLAPKGKKEIDKDIKNEVKECQEILEKAREELNEIKEKVNIEIKNEWRKENENDQGISLVDLEKLLDTRPLKEDTFKLIILLTVIFIFSLNPKISLISFQFAISGVVLFVLMSFVIMFLTVNGHYGKIKQMMDASKRVRDSYLRKLDEEFDRKKEYIDKQICYRIAEKNFLLAKKEEKKIEEKIELLGCYKEIIENHCQITDNILNTLKGMKNNSVDEKDYRNESFSNKLEDLNSKKAPFENDIFNLSRYIEVEEYKKFNVLYNDQENLFVPQNIFGCDSIKIYEDEIYKKVGE